MKAKVTHSIITSSGETSFILNKDGDFDIKIGTRFLFNNKELTIKDVENIRFAFSDKQSNNIAVIFNEPINLNYGDELLFDSGVE